VPKSLDLRSSTRADFAFIVTMARHACVIEDWPLPAPDSDDVQSLLPRDDDIVLIAADEEAVNVGAAWTFRHQPPLVVDDAVGALVEIAVAVVPGRRGNGIGSALLDALGTHCTGVHTALTLNVHRRNPALHLYQRKGFGLIGPGRGALGIAMIKHLPTPLPAGKA
jgi:GNAT superfamily N-acetyltransferase